MTEHSLAPVGGEPETLSYVTSRRMTFPWIITRGGTQAEMYPSLLTALTAHPRARVDAEGLVRASQDVVRLLMRHQIITPGD